MKPEEFRALLDALIAIDPWAWSPISRELLAQFAQREAEARGYRHWLDAYNYLDPLTLDGVHFDPPHVVTPARHESPP